MKNPMQSGGFLGDLSTQGMGGMFLNPAFMGGLGLLANRGNMQGLLSGVSLSSQLQQQALNNKFRMQQLQQQKEKQDAARMKAEMQQDARNNLVNMMSQKPQELAGPPMPGQQMGYRMETNPQLQQQYSTLATAYPETFQEMVKSKYAPAPIKPTAGMQDYAFSQQVPGYAEFLKSKTPQTNINMPAQESESQKAYGKSVGGFYGDQFAQLQQGVKSAMQSNAMLDRLDQLLDQVNTGATAGITQPMKRYAKDFGIDLGVMGITDDTGPAEAAQALSNQMALELRNPAGGAGMPGALSDKDREFLTSMVPQMTTTPEGRKMLIETKRRQNKRAMEVAKLARGYQQRNGMLDAGFYQELQDYSDAHPLFADLEPPTMQTRPMQGGAAEEVRELGGKRYIKINGEWFEE